MKKHAFIIQAVGEKGSEPRQRADRVLESIIEPACAATGYEAIRADQLITKTIVEPIISALNTHPLVIADLAAPPWNLNVLVEVGFRLATGRAIIFLADTDPKPEILPLHLRNVRIHTINSTAPTNEDVTNLIESIKKYGPEVNYWESDYPTIEFSIAPTSPEGGRFIFANEKAAKVYGLTHPDELIGKPINEVDPRLREFIDPDHFREYETDQLAILGRIMRRVPGPKTAKVPLWFTKHPYIDEKYQIYWPVLVQYRYVSPEDEADIVMRVIFINVKEWDVIAPEDRSPPQVLKLPELFRQDPRPASYTHDVFLSYNSKDREYVKEVYELLERFGLIVWYDERDLTGQGSLAAELLDAISRSLTIFVVIGQNQLGAWQKPVEVAPQLYTHLLGEKPILPLLLPDIQNPETWTESLPAPLRTIFRDRLYYPLPSLDEFRTWANSGRSSKVVARLFTFIVQLIRGSRHPVLTGPHRGARARNPTP